MMRGMRLSNQTEWVRAVEKRGLLTPPHPLESRCQTPPRWDAATAGHSMDAVYALGPAARGYSSDATRPRDESRLVAVRSEEAEGGAAWGGRDASVRVPTVAVG